MTSALHEVDPTYLRRNRAALMVGPLASDSLGGVVACRTRALFGSLLHLAQLGQRRRGRSRFLARTALRIQGRCSPARIRHSPDTSGAWAMRWQTGDFPLAIAFLQHLNKGVARPSAASGITISCESYTGKSVHFSRLRTVMYPNHHCPHAHSTRRGTGKAVAKEYRDGTPGTRRMSQGSNGYS